MAFMPNIPTIDFKMFHRQWLPDGALLFSQEMSSLEYAARVAREGLPFKQIYDDACDEGLAIKGNKDTLIFAFSEDSCGPNHHKCEDIHGWRGELVPEQQRKLSIKVEVLIIND